MIDPVTAHAACVALVGADMAARAARIRLLVSHLGGRLSVGDALRLNLLGDAAAELTPFRLAGEPSRVAGLLQSGVRADAALLAVGAEFVLSYAVIALLVVTASWSALPAWWSSFAPAAYHAVSRAPLWAIVLLALAAGSSVPLALKLRTATRLPRPAGIRSSMRALRGIRPNEVAGILALTGVNVAARVGILWMLVAMLPGATKAGAVLVGSFLLLFGQAFAPTPSGLGVVDLGMLGGAAGSLGAHAISILFFWRAYTALVPIVLAAVFAVPRFRAGRVLAMLGLRRVATRPALDVAEPARPAVLSPADIADYS